MTVNDFLLSERPRKVTFQTLSPYFGTLRYSRHPVQQTKNSIPTFEKILFPLPVFLLRQKRIPQAALPGQSRFSTKGFRDPIKEVGPIGGGLDQAGAQGGKQTEESMQRFSRGKENLHGIVIQCFLRMSCFKLFPGVERL